MWGGPFQGLAICPHLAPWSHLVHDLLSSGWALWGGEGQGLGTLQSKRGRVYAWDLALITSGSLLLLLSLHFLICKRGMGVQPIALS